jgi:hypothetical protein
VDADTFDRRLEAASDRLRGLATRLESGGPWPLAERFDHAPEAAWGPRETLAHLEEMLSFWLGEAERVIDMSDGPAPFGRVATDGLRLAVIERDRTLPIRELVARVQNGITRWRTRWAELDDTDRGRTGVHATLGGLQVAEIGTRFVAHHLEEHLDQLEAAVASHGTRPPG